MPRWSQFIQYVGFRVVTPLDNLTALEIWRLGRAGFDLEAFLVAESDDDSFFDEAV